MIGRGKTDGGLQALGSCPVSDELFPVVIGNGVNMATQRVQALNRGAMRGGSWWPGQFRDGREQAFTLDLRQQPALMSGAHDGVALPVSEPCLAIHDRRQFRDIDPLRNYATARVLCPTPAVRFASSPQELPEIPTPALVCPDHLVDPFMAEVDPACGPQPKADLLRTPPFCPQLTGDGATDLARQFARLVPDLLLAGPCRALRLLNAVAPPSSVPSQFLAEPPVPGRSRPGSCPPFARRTSNIDFRTRSDDTSSYVPPWCARGLLHHAVGELLHWRLESAPLLSLPA